MGGIAAAVCQAAPVDWPEPDVGILDGNRRGAPPMPLQVFGPFWRTWIEAQAKAKSAPTDYIAAGLLSTSSVLIGNARWVSAWAGWKEPPTIWTAVVRNPSAGKSPALDAAMDLLRQIEAELNTDFAERRRRRAAAVEHARASREAWQREIREAQKQGLSPPPMPAEAEEPDPVGRIRVLATDATPEKLVRLLLPNPRGLLYFRDELAGWLGSMDKYGGNGSERALWLEAYNGRPYVVDRIKDPEPIHVQRLTVVLAGGIQPDRLASGLLAGDDDGLAARILYFWPEPVPPQRPEGAVDDTAALAAMRRLRDLRMAVSEAGDPCPQILMLTDGAASELQTFREANANAEKGAAGTYLSWLGKLSGVACRLSLILEHLWWSGDLTQGDPPRQITVAAALGAIAMISNYLTPMAERVFGDAALPQAERNATTIARWIVRERPDIFNVRDLRRKKLPGLQKAEHVRAAVAELVEASWLLPVPSREGGTVGRQREDFRVTPRLWELIE